MPPPLPPVGLPPPEKPVTRLLKRPMYLAMGVGAVLITTAGVAILGGKSESQKSAEQPDAAPAPQGDNNGLLEALRNAPNSAEIAARQKAKPKPTPPPDPTHNVGMQINSVPAAPPAIPDDMTDAAIAMRRAAWAAYSQQLADIQQKRFERAKTSMTAELVEATPAEQAPAPSAPGNGTATAKGPQDFFSANASSPATDYSPYTLTSPISPYEIKTTDIITAKLESQIDSDRPGIIRARVTKNVLDHATGGHILIPQGSILKGVYDTNINYGQTGVTTAWQRIIYPAPCDQSLDLGAMPGSDQTGEAGFEDITDNHLAKVFGAAILVSVFGAASQLSQPAGNSFSSYSPTQTISSSIGQQTSQLGTEFARKGLSIPPTQRVRQGYPFTVMLTKDIPFLHPWKEGVCEPMEVTPE